MLSPPLGAVRTRGDVAIRRDQSSDDAAGSRVDVAVCRD